MINQYRINLNRQEGYIQREERRRRIRERITILIATLLLLSMGFVNYQKDHEMREIIKGKERQLNRIIAQIDSLQRVGQNVSKDDVMALARLDRDRVFWTKKLRALTERMPDKMAVTELQLERDQFIISAISQIQKNEKEFDKVKLFMDRLRATPMFFEDFRNMKFTESKRDNRDGQELLNFVITCEVDKVKESGTTGTRRSRTAGELPDLPTGR